MHPGTGGWLDTWYRDRGMLGQVGHSSIGVLYSSMTTHYWQQLGTDAPLTGQKHVPFVQKQQ
jgi:hypothetical protein